VELPIVLSTTPQIPDKIIQLKVFTLKSNKLTSKQLNKINPKNVIK
jgi:hypothetical protein